MTCSKVDFWMEIEVSSVVFVVEFEVVLVPATQVSLDRVKFGAQEEQFERLAYSKHAVGHILQIPVTASR